MKNHIKNHSRIKNNNSAGKSEKHLCKICNLEAEAWTSIEKEIKETVRKERSLFINSALLSCGIN